MKEEIKVDAKRLIAEVYKRSPLWNQKDVLYHNRDVSNQIWMELSALLGLPKAVLKAKWKGLRDTFRAEIKKEQLFPKSKYQRTKSVWVHYKRLLFLKDQMLPRPPIWERENYHLHGNNKNLRESTSSSKNEQPIRVSRFGIRIKSLRKNPKSNAVKTISSDISSVIDDSYTSNAHEINERYSSDNTLTPNETNQNNLINNTTNDSSNGHNAIVVKDEPVEEIIENMKFENAISSGSSSENEMLQAVSPEQVLMTNIGETCQAQLTVDPLEGNRLDDNYYFLMSLLPHIKILPAERRMLLRMQMQELVYKEVYKKNKSEADNSSS